MPQFADEREAKEFAIGLILPEAEQTGTPLSELERRMLYFSETGWTVPGIAETAQKFDGECDSGRYEKKVTALTKRLLKRLLSDDPKTLEAWSAALQKLSGGDHYLLALTLGNASSARPPHDFLKLCVTALLIVLASTAVMLILPEHAVRPFIREQMAFVIWLIAAITVVAFALLSLITGRERANELFGRLMSKIFEYPAAKIRIPFGRTFKSCR